MINDDINTIKYVYEDLKKIIMSCVIKYDNIGRKYENAESKREYDYYFIARNELDDFGSYPFFPKEVLKRAGIIDKEQLQDCFEDKLLIPYLLQKKVIEENRKYIIENYEEKNNYYRMLIGLPDIEDMNYIYLDKETCNKYKVRENIPIHKYSDYEINNISSVLEELKEKYPDKKYLNYLGDKKVDLLRARSARNFEIIRIDLKYHNVILKSFLDTYEMCREYFTSVIYVKEKNAKDDLYDNFIALNIMFMTIQRMFVNTFKMGVERDFYDLDSIRKLFKSYNIPFFETLPIDYQRLIMKRLNILLRAKSTDKCLYDIVDILLPNKANIMEYYLMKEQKYDEDDIPLNILKEKIGIDGYPDYVEDAFKTYDVYFESVDIKEVGVNMSLENKPNRYDYHEVVDEDPQWWHDDDLIQVLDEREFNYIETKYIGINLMYHLTQMMFETVYFVNMLADKKDDYHRPNDGFFLTINLPRITQDPVSIFDAIILMCALLCKRRNFAGNIIDSGTKILTVMGFDFEENFDLIRKDIIKNKKIVDQKILKFLDITKIGSKEDINTIYNNMVELASFCVEHMNSTDDVKTYHAYKYLYDALMVKKYTTNIMTKSDGNVASTYLDYLDDQNPMLASVVRASDSEKCGIYIEHILGMLNELIPDIEYLTTINGTDNILVTALVKLILFFKSYTVDLRNLNVMYVMDSRRYNMIKLVKDLTIMIKMKPHERISFYLDLIHQLKNEIFYDEYIEPLERLVEISKLSYKDAVDPEVWEKVYSVSRIFYEEILYALYADSMKFYSIKEIKSNVNIQHMTTFYFKIILKDEIYTNDDYNIDVRLKLNSLLEIVYGDQIRDITENGSYRNSIDFSIYHDMYENNSEEDEIINYDNCKNNSELINREKSYIEAYSDKLYNDEHINYKVKLDMKERIKIEYK